MHRVGVIFALLAFAPGFAAQPAGNRHPLARPEFDTGMAAAETPMERMILVLQPDEARRQALDALIEQQHDPHAALYHQWLGPEEFGERFGVSRDDIGRVVAWLGARGFTINEIPAGGRTIVFSGTAGQVQAAFRTAIHRYRVRGAMHLANADEPRIPAFLGGVVAGVATMHDFRRQPMHARLQAAPDFSASASYHYLSPGDFGTIYDVAPLYGNGITGAGQTIAIVARCNIPVSDVQAFRRTFGLPSNDPTIVLNGPDPGIVSDDELAEADLDVQWSGAVAPQAAVNFVVSASTYATDGVDLSAQYIVSHNLAGVMSTSFGSCEQYLGATERAFYNNLWQQAAAQGITTLIASGDSGAGGCDGANESAGTGGQAVNGLCSTPYSVCVGGTQFSDGTNLSQYWSRDNSSTLSSALGYIPEAVWNESGSNSGLGLWASGGGASAYYAKPVWQSAPGVPSDGQRDVPDVSLTAADHDAYLLYWRGTMVAVGGTSAASPAFAGLMALVDQQAGERQGNANTSLYPLATLQGAGGRAYFHDTVNGNNSVPGVSGFGAAAGYDLATGLGSVDAAILVNHWSDAVTGGVSSFTLHVSPSSISVRVGSAGAVTAQVQVAGGFNADVVLAATGLPAGVTASFAPATVAAPGSGSSTLTLTASAGAVPGTYPVVVAASSGGVTKTFPLSLTVSAAAGCTMTAAPASISINAGDSVFMQVSCGSVRGGFSTPLAVTVSGAPQGVTISVSPASLLPGTAQSKVTVSAASSAPTGKFTLTVAVAGGGLSLSLPVVLTINPAPTFNFTMTPAGITVLQGAAGKATVSTTHIGTFSAPIALSASGAPVGVTASFSPASIADPGDGTSILIVQSGSGSATGTYNLTVTASGGGQSKTVTLRVTIQVPPGFSMSVAQNALTVGQGSIAGVNVVTSGLLGGFNSPVVLSVSAPGGMHPSFTPAAIAAPGAGTSILALAPDSSVAPGIYPLTVTASGGGVVHAAPLSVSVTPPPGFTLHAGATALNVLVGGMASTRITSTGVNGFTSTVGLSSTKLAGMIVTFTPASIPGSNGTSTLTVQTSGAAVAGTYTLTVSGAGGGKTANVPITLNVGKLALIPQNTAVVVKHGGGVNLTIQTKITGSYTGAVSFSATGLPKGVTAQFSGLVSSSCILQLAAAPTATSGVGNIMINAVSDGISTSVPIRLTVQ